MTCVRPSPCHCMGMERKLQSETVKDPKNQATQDDGDLRASFCLVLDWACEGSFIAPGRCSQERSVLMCKATRSVSVWGIVWHRQGVSGAEARRQNTLASSGELYGMGR